MKWIRNKKLKNKILKWNHIHSGICKIKRIFRRAVMRKLSFVHVFVKSFVQDLLKR